MSAPARFPKPIRVDETRREAALRATISVHCANRDEVEMAARVDIATLRDQASAGLSRACDSAAVLLGEVARLGAQAVYAPLPTSQLIRIRSALVLTIEAARALERVHVGGR